jgi:ATP-dependent DNA helicase RecQ
VVVKTQGKNSGLKLYIIQQIDRKVPLDKIARDKDMDYAELLDTISHIIYSGSKLNLSYFIEETIDEDRYDEIYAYFREAETDDIDAAQEELGPDYTWEELMLVRCQFMSELAN